MRLVEKKAKKIQLNITSLIDVVLLLLIFFMLTTSFTEQPGMKLDLPETESSTNEEVSPFEIQVSDTEQIFFNGEEISLEDLAIKLVELKNDTDNSVVLKADKTASHGAVVAIMDLVKDKGFKKLVIATKNK